MSTKQLFAASSAVVLLIIIIIGVIIWPKHATAPNNALGVAATSSATSSTPGYTVTVASTTTTVSTATPAFNLDYWLGLGITRKEVGDYAGAVQAWGEATKGAPTNYVAFYNLGDLYQNFDKNFPLAEQNYLKVIALKPDYIDAYRSLYTLYHAQGYKAGTSAAADIVALGLKNNPGNADLLNMQAQLNAGK